MTDKALRCYRCQAPWDFTQNRREPYVLTFYCGACGYTFVNNILATYDEYGELD